MRLASYIRKAIIGFKGSLWSFTYPLREQEYAQKKVVACIFSLGERSELSCIESVKKQRFPLHRIEIIKNITPMHEAFNHMFDVAADADYILCVDADMVLDSACTQELIRLARPDVLYSVATLRDPVLGRVGYIKLLNMLLVNTYTVRFRNVFGCDVDFVRQMLERDKSIQAENYTIMRKPLGIHRPTYTAIELFRKNQIEKKKRGGTINLHLLISMVKAYQKSNNPVLLAGIMGELIPNSDPSTGEASPETGLHNWPKVEAVIGKIPNDMEYGFNIDSSEEI